MSTEPTAPSATPPDQPAEPIRRPPVMSRRRLFALGAGGLVAVAASVGAADTALGGPLRQRVAKAVSPSSSASSATSEPYTAKVLTPARNVGPGDLFISDMAETDPRLVIIDSAGRELWSKSGARSYADFRLQTYQGQPVFTWWESDSVGLAAYGDGRAVVADTSGNEITSIGTRGKVSPDEHEFFLTPSGTALITSYVKTQVDLSHYGGSTTGWVMDGVFEEIDLATGTVLMRWSALDHVKLTESYAKIPSDPDEPYDYFHINSVKRTPDGHYLVSARHVWAVYQVHARTGAVMWRLGGRKSDYKLTKTATFAWQHDAQFETADTIRLFDNGSDGTVVATPESRVLWLKLNQTARTVTLTRQLAHPDKVSAAAMGNAEPLANGNLVVGWGTAKRISEFAPDGTLVFDAELPNMTYRCFRNTWR